VSTASEVARSEN